MTSGGQASATVPAPASPVKVTLRALWNAFGQSPAWPLLLALIVFFAIGNPKFLTPFNISSVLNQTVLIGVLAVGLTPLVISGNVDLSVGAITALCACLAVYLQGVAGFVPAILLTLVAGMAIGLLNGAIVERLGLNSIIVTLAAATGYRGLAFLLFGEQTVSAPDSQFLDIGGIKFLFGGMRVSIGVFIFLAVALLVAWMLRATFHGVHTYAIGGNRRAAADAGVAVSSHVLGNFALSGATAGLCGLLFVGELGAASPTYARDYELWAIIAVVLGGTRLAGGRGTILGTVVAALSLAVLRNGVTILRIEVRYVLIILGAALIGALALDRLRSGEPETAE